MEENAAINLAAKIKEKLGESEKFKTKGAEINLRFLTGREEMKHLLKVKRIKNNFLTGKIQTEKQIGKNRRQNRKRHCEASNKIELNELNSVKKRKIIEIGENFEHNSDTNLKSRIEKVHEKKKSDDIDIKRPCTDGIVESLKSYTAQVLGRKKHDDCTIIPSQVEIQHIVVKVTPKTMPEMTPKTPEMTPKMLPKTISPEISPKVDEIQENEKSFDEILAKLPLSQAEEAMDIFFVGNEAAIGKVTPKTPEMTPKNSEMTPKSLEMTPKTPEMTSKTPEMTPKTPKMTPKMLPETKSFHEENGEIDLEEKIEEKIGEFDLINIEEADIGFSEGQEETDYLVHTQSVLKMHKDEKQSFFVANSWLK